jgi:exopolysaccharide production protein ExoZ
MENGKRRLSYVQISRAVAILFVLLGHVNILFYTDFKYDWFHMGEWDRTGGVDFFFIVTGFMIYYLYHRHVGVPGKTTEFLLKRLIRIYPLYWVFTLLAIAVSFVYPSMDGAYSLNLIIRSIFLLHTHPILASTWSLSHVMLFYFIFTAYMSKPKVVKPIVLFWIAASLLIGLKIIPFYSFFTNFSNIEILSGCLIAHLTLKYTFKKSSLLVGLGLLGFLAVWINNAYHFIGIPDPIFYWLFAMIFMLGISEKDKKNRKVPKVLSFLGDASYSIYIAHGPFLQIYILILKKLGVISSIGYFFSMVIVIILTVISTCFVYIGIEKPMSKYLRGLIFKKKVINSVKTPIVVAK